MKTKSCLNRSVAEKLFQGLIAENGWRKLDGSLTQEPRKFPKVIQVLQRLGADRYRLSFIFFPPSLDTHAFISLCTDILDKDYFDDWFWLIDLSSISVSEVNASFMVASTLGWSWVSSLHILATVCPGLGLTTRTISNNVLITTLSRSRHIGQKYYSSKIIFYECVPVATHWSKHIHGK